MRTVSDPPILYVSLRANFALAGNQNSGKTTLLRILAGLEELLGRDLALRLLGAGVVGLDLEKVIEPQSQIFLTGGHRHADFCA